MPQTIASPNLELESAAARIVKQLGGTWTERGGMCLCPVHADRRPSLSVRVGASSLLFHCFAGCDRLDVLRAVRRLRLDVPAMDAPLIEAWRPREAAIAARARMLWDDAIPLLDSAGSPYLARRGLSGHCPGLRFHPRTPLGGGRSVRLRPAIVAAVRSGADDVVALERLFIDLPSGLPAADLDPPKRLLGRPRDGAVHFGVPGTTLGLAEGWETAFSAHILLGIPVWATLGSERLARVAVPDRVTRLILLPDNDQPGLRGAGKAAAAHAREGRAIDLLLPSRGHNDWNDQLRNGGKREGIWVRKAA
jgi:putative DNA primase/helicase